jgi:hypothetical protein
MRLPRTATALARAARGGPAIVRTSALIMMQSMFSMMAHTK